MGLQDIWGPLVAWDLFLAGAGAGAYLIGVIAGLMGERYKAINRMGVFLGAPLVGIGALILLVDLGQPMRFMLGFLQPQSSIMSIGIIIITVFLVLGAINFVLQLFKKAPKLTWLWVITAVFAFGVMSYTGLLLGVVKAIPFWNTPLLPLLFICSALATGAGAILLGLAVKRWIRPKVVEADEDNTKASLLFLGKLTVTLVVVELIVIAFMLLITGYSGTMQASITFLLTGDYALVFWLGLIVIGLIVPLVAGIAALTKSGTLAVPRISDLGAVCGICLLAGGVMLRFSILAAGAPMGMF